MGRSSRVFWVLGLFLAGFAVLILFVSLWGDFSQFRAVVSHLSFIPLLGVLLATALAFTSSGASLYSIFRTTRYRVPWARFFPITFIADTMNFVISSGGMSSIAIRSFFLKEEKVPYMVTVSLSLVQNTLFNLVLAGACAGGFYYLKGHPEFTGGPKEEAISVFVGGLFLVMAVLLLVFISRSFRDRVLRGALLGIYRLRVRFSRRRVSLKPILAALGEIERTLALLKAGWPYLLLTLGLILSNWGFMALAFYFSFHAAGMDLPAGVLLIGFLVVFLTSNVSPVPAGLGVSESALAVTYKLMGFGFEKTLVSVLIFRSVYYLMPILVATVLFLDRIRSYWKGHRG